MYCIEGARALVLHYQVTGEHLCYEKNILSSVILTILVSSLEQFHKTSGWLLLDYSYGDLFQQLHDSSMYADNIRVVISLVRSGRNLSG